MNKTTKMKVHGTTKTRKQTWQAQGGARRPSARHYKTSATISRARRHDGPRYPPRNPRTRGPLPVARCALHGVRLASGEPAMGSGAKVAIMRSCGRSSGARKPQAAEAQKKWRSWRLSAAAPRAFFLFFSHSSHMQASRASPQAHPRGAGRLCRAISPAAPQPNTSRSPAASTAALRRAS